MPRRVQYLRGLGGGGTHQTYQSLETSYAPIDVAHQIDEHLQKDDSSERGRFSFSLHNA